MPQEETKDLTQKEISQEELDLQASQAALAEAEKANKPEAATKTLAEQYAEEQAALAAEKPAEVTEPAAAEVKAEATNAEETTPGAEGKAEPQTDPKVNAIVALRKHAQLLQEQLFFERGQKEALAKMIHEGIAPAAQPAKKDRLEEIKEAKLVLAQQVDAGEKTVAEYEAERTALEDEAFELRMQRVQPAQKKEGSPNDDLYLAEQTDKLVNKYPFLNGLTEEDMAPFYTLAMRNAQREGIELKGALGTLELRRRMVEIAAKVYQPEVRGEVKDATVPAVVDDTKQKALAAKLDLQTKMPVDTSKIGSAASSGVMTEAEYAAKLFAARDDDEAAQLLEQMPLHLRDKLSTR